MLQLILEATLPAQISLIFSANTIKWVSFSFLAIGGIIGLYINSLIPGNKILFIGILGMIVGFFYSAPPFAASYRRFGELFVGIGFGPLIVVGSCITDLTVVTKKKTTTEEVNAAFDAVAAGRMKNILRVEKRPLVLKDFVGDPHSCIIDASLTDTQGGNLVKVFGWYDNEWGYSNRLVELAEFIGRKV
jgi:hypothetical protein